MFENTEVARMIEDRIERDDIYVRSNGIVALTGDEKAALGKPCSGYNAIYGKFTTESPFTNCGSLPSQ